MTAPLQSPRFAAYADTGAPLVGGLLWTMASGTTTPKAAFQDAALSIAHTTNPIVLNARGEASVWLGEGAYRLRLTTPDDRTLWDVSGVTGPEALGTAKTLTDALRAELAGGGATQGAAMVALRDPSSKWAAVNLEELAGEVDSRLSTLAIAQAGHGSRLSTAEGTLTEYGPRLAAVEALAAAADASGPFTPVLVGAAQSGTVNLSGVWSRSGKSVAWSVTVTCIGAGQWSSAAGSTRITGLPFSTLAAPSAFSAAYLAGSFVGCGCVSADGVVNLPAVATQYAINGAIALSGSFIIA
jgi:hypothetical protein